MNAFDPNAAAPKDSGIFGLPYTEKESSLVLLPVPWETTTSYGGGTSRGPRAILEASRQVDLFDLDVLRPYESGIHLLPESKEVLNWNETARPLAQKVIKGFAQDSELKQVNELCSKMNQFVYGESKRIIQAGGKILGIVGGDHSVPFGGLQAVSEKFPSLGILHFDAHSDTRKAFEGFTWSHASIMYNVIEKIPAVAKLIQVGIRDLCEEEWDYCSLRKSKISIFSDRECKNRKFSGVSWERICYEIIATLPNEVWISFDIDGLDPRFCPHTGTPVPGGLEFAEASFLIGLLVKSGRRIIGFDLNEVAPNLEDPQDEWDGNVGARMLYKLSGWTLASQSKAKLLI